jgi:hypothetical protein
MSNNKNEKNSDSNNIEMTKKTSLPLIVGTSAMIIASVISMDSSVSLEVARLNNLNSASYIQDEDEDEDGEGNNFNENEGYEDSTVDSTIEDSMEEEEVSPFFIGGNGELFYDSSRDDNERHGAWDDFAEDDDDDKFMIW